MTSSVGFLPSKNATVRTRCSDSREASAVNARNEKAVMYLQTNLKNAVHEYKD